MSRAILHIGTEKTGSTALQEWLAANQELLGLHGFRHSTAAGTPNNTHLAAHAQDDHKLDDLRMVLRLAEPGRLAAFRADLARRLAAEAAGHPGLTMIFSTEHCHSRLVSRGEVARLHDLLRPLFDDMEVVVYLRRQDQVASSLYSTMVRNGGTRRHVIDQTAHASPYYDYPALLERWGAVFGEERLSVRLFERGELRGGSVVTDFCERLGIAVPDGGDRRANEALAPEYQEFLRRLNEHLPSYVDKAPNPKRGRVDEFVSLVGAGAGRKPTRAAAEAFYGRVREDNELVRRRWFPDRARLFTEDFDSYPDTSAPPPLSPDDLMRLFAEIWGAAAERRLSLARQVAALQAEVERLRRG